MLYVRSAATSGAQSMVAPERENNVINMEEEVGYAATYRQNAEQDSAHLLPITLV